jgi:hypothetical protein
VCVHVRLQWFDNFFQHKTLDLPTARTSLGAEAKCTVPPVNPNFDSWLADYIRYGKIVQAAYSLLAPRREMENEAIVRKDRFLLIGQSRRSGARNISLAKQGLERVNPLDRM